MANNVALLSSMAPDESPALIRFLNENDALLGRGAGPSNFIGNRRFQDLMESRREEYSSKSSSIDKVRIAKEMRTVS